MISFRELAILDECVGARGVLGGRTAARADDGGKGHNDRREGADDVPGQLDMCRAVATFEVSFHLESFAWA